MVTAEHTLEQRRAETWNSIHKAAAQLAIDGGLAKATIDAIAEAAGISRRTFFNYFATKEDAVLGLTEPRVPAEALAKFQSSEDDLLSGLAHFMLTVSRTSYRFAPNVKQRRMLIKQNPELKMRQMHYAAQAQELISPILFDRLRDGPMLASGNDESASRALLMLCRTIVQYAYLQNPGSTKITRAHLDSAIETFRNVLKED